MKFARREGAQLFLVTLGHAVRTDMLEHSDLVLDAPIEQARGVADLWQWKDMKAAVAQS